MIYLIFCLLKMCFLFQAMKTADITFFLIFSSRARRSPKQRRRQQGSSSPPDADRDRLIATDSDGTYKRPPGVSNSAYVVSALSGFYSLVE